MQECPTYGTYAAVVLVGNIVRGESLGFRLNGCGQAWPFTGSCWSGGLEATSFASSKADLQSHYGRGVVSVVPAWARWLNRATSSASSRAGDRFLPPVALERLIGVNHLIEAQFLALARRSPARSRGSRIWFTAAQSSG